MPADDFYDTHDDDFSDLVVKFSGYCISIEKPSIRQWLRQFDNEEHREIGLSLLQTVDYYSQDRSIRELKLLHRQLLALLDGDADKIYFVAYGPPAKSGQELLYKYRLANRLTHAKWQPHFKYISELQELLQKEAIIAFVDDFVGTGDTVVKSWDTVKPLVPEDAKLYFLALVGFGTGIDRIQKETGMDVVLNRRLTESDRIFSPDNQEFSNTERDILKGYCERAGEWPEGYGNSQARTVFYYRAPNNTISILRCKNTSWKGLFPRNF